MTRGRTLGKVSIGQAVISANYAEMRIDIDAEESVHHVRLDTMVIFQFPIFCQKQQLVQVFHSPGAVWSLPRAAAAASSLGAALSSPLRRGRSPGRGGERGGSFFAPFCEYYSSPRDCT